MQDYVIKKNHLNQEAIFHITTKKQISKWWKSIDILYKPPQSPQYYLATNEQGLQAIFCIDDPNTPISQWFKEISLSGLVEGTSKYYIATKEDHHGLLTKWKKIFSPEEEQQAIFRIDDPNTPITRWWKRISKAGLVNGESEYYIAQNKYGKEAIFHIRDPDQPISQWWDEVTPQGIIEGITDYYVVRNHQGLYALFHKDYPDQPLSGWWNYIYLGLSKEYYVAENSNEDKAIFHINHPHQPISRWWHGIGSYGIIQGYCDYYVAINENKKEAIFHKDDPYKPASQWWAKILPYGLMKGESEYYIAKDVNQQHAIFHKDVPNIPISQWWPYIYEEYGLINGGLEYYLVQNYSNQVAVFHKDNPDTALSCWGDHIYRTGLLNNASKYFVIKTNNQHIEVYHMDEPNYPLYEIPHRQVNAVLHVNENFAIIINKDDIILYDANFMESTHLQQLSDSVNAIIKELDTTINLRQTDILIGKYIQYDLIPIDLNKQLCLYNIEGNLLGRFNNLQTMEEYIQNHFINNHNATDMMILYHS